MKKLYLLLVGILLSLTLFAQTNYEKYWLEKEREDHPTLYAQDTTSVDTLYDASIVIEENEPVVINNYYYNDYEDQNQPNMRFNLTFGYFWSPYWYNSWYYPYYPYYSPYYYSYWYRPYYYGRCYSPYYSYPSGNRYASSSALGRTGHYYRANNTTYKTGVMNRPVTRKHAVNTTRPVLKSTNSNRTIKKTYTPRYRSVQKTANNRPSYNRSSKGTRSTYSRTPASTYRKSTGIARTRNTYRKPTTRTRSYSSPARSTYKRSTTTKSYSPSRSYTPSRSYSPSRSSGSRSSGSMNRSSSGGKRK